MVKVDKETRRIYADDDPYLQSPEAKTKDFSDKYSSSIYVIDAEKSKIAKFLGFNSPGLYAIKIK
ncbi:MAG: DNA-directed RNA polymerase subunit E'' [Candidatus Micrarchaeota archaeon]|nr:DNA-directed RNA polymerase subunit E'' [Candidatus Micrarchaeota archaeon]